MIIRVLLFVFGAGVLFFLFTSNSGGPQSPYTGAPGESGTSCNACHGGGNFNTMVDIDLLNQDSAVVSAYGTNQTYLVRLRVSGVNGPKGFGFQLVSLDELTNSDMGLWSKLPANVREQNLLSRKYLVHSVPSGSGIYYFNWTSPAENRGNIRFYAAGLAANMNGGTTGDRHATLVKTVPFDLTSGVDDARLTHSKSFVYPNPVRDFLHIDHPEARQILIFDRNGKLHFHFRDHRDGNKPDVSMLKSGIYAIIIKDKDGQMLGSQLIFKE